jgi:hypothetical protein
MNRIVSHSIINGILHFMFQDCVLVDTDVIGKHDARRQQCIQHLYSTFEPSVKIAESDLILSQPGRDIRIFFCLIGSLHLLNTSIMKKTFNSDSQQFYQYQQNEQSPLILNELAKHKKTTTYDLGNPGPKLRQAQICGGLNRLMRSSPSPLDKLISNCNIYI